MATKTKRVLVTPTERTRLILERYTAVTGKPMAGMIRELMDEAAPIMLEVIEMTERLQNRPSLQKEQLLKFAETGHQRINAIQQDIEGLFEKKRGRKPKGTRCKT